MPLTALTGLTYIIGTVRLFWERRVMRIVPLLTAILVTSFLYLAVFERDALLAQRPGWHWDAVASELHCEDGRDLPLTSVRPPCLLRA